MTKKSSEFDDLLNDYFTNNILKSPENGTVPELLKDVKPQQSLSLHYSDLSKISTNTESGTDFLEKLLNGDSTGGVNSTGNVDYSKMDRQLNNYLDKSVKTDEKENQDPKHDKIGTLQGTMDDVAKIDSLKHDDGQVLETGQVLEAEEDSWPNTSDVKITNAEDETSPNYEEDFDDEAEELEVITKDHNSEDYGTENVKEITELEPNSETTLKSESEKHDSTKNLDSEKLQSEKYGFDLSPIHSSQIKTPGESLSVMDSKILDPNINKEFQGVKSQDNFISNLVSDVGYISPKRVSISISNEQTAIEHPRPTAATQQRREFTQKSITEKQKFKDTACSKNSWKEGIF